MGHLVQPPPVSACADKLLHSHYTRAAEYVAAAIREQNQFLDEALKMKRFWQLWNTRQSEEMLRGVYSALAEAFGLGMHTAAVQVQPSARCPPEHPPHPSAGRNLTLSHANNPRSRSPWRVRIPGRKQARQAQASSHKYGPCI